MGASISPASGLRILLSSEQIQQRVREMGAQISGDYRGRPLHLVCILKGASIFLADLLRTLELEVSLDFIAVSSYHKGSGSSGEVQIIKDLNLPLEGRDVLIVEDIVDTGLTLNYLCHLLESRGARGVPTPAGYRPRKRHGQWRSRARFPPERVPRPASAGCAACVIFSRRLRPPRASSFQIRNIIQATGFTKARGTRSWLGASRGFRIPRSPVAAARQGASKAFCNAGGLL